MGRPPGKRDDLGRQTLTAYY